MYKNPKVEIYEQNSCARKCVTGGKGKHRVYERSFRIDVFGQNLKCNIILCDIIIIIIIRFNEANSIWTIETL